jgi:hypothetical protein
LRLDYAARGVIRMKRLRVKELMGVGLLEKCARFESLVLDVNQNVEERNLNIAEF